MKVEIKEKGKNKEKEFPKLMIANDSELVLFTEIGVGTVLNPVEWSFGHFGNTWVMDEFQDFEGSITLSND